MIAKPFNWKIFLILLAACTWGVIAIFPYSLELQAKTLEAIELPMPLWLLLIIQVLQQVVLFAIVIGLGLLLANRTGLGLPILEAKLAGEPVWKRIKAFLPLSIVLGVVGSALIIGLEVWFFAPALTAEMGDKFAAANLGGQPAAWKGLLASFYGGVNEEVLMRLFFMTLLAWLGKFISKTVDGKPTAIVFWIANILAAILFGLGHLPAMATAGVSLTPLFIIRSIVLNGLLGIAFGYLYVKYGLEAAIASHFSADIVLHVLLAL